MPSSVLLKTETAGSRTPEVQIFTQNPPRKAGDAMANAVHTEMPLLSDFILRIEPDGELSVGKFYVAKPSTARISTKTWR